MYGIKIKSLLVATIIILHGTTMPVGAQTRSDSLDGFIIKREFIYQNAPFASAHASTIVETPSRTLMAAWFGGTNEGNDDVEIWLSRKPLGESWSEPFRLTDTPEMPTWNPVLFQDGGRTLLFFKIGPSPREWIGAYRISSDDGKAWKKVEYLPAGLTGPVRAKPIMLSDGTWLSGTSTEAGYDNDTRPDAPYRSWSVWIERSTDKGLTWVKHGPIVVPNEPYGIIQPTMWEDSDSNVHMLMRSTERLGRIMTADSKDGGSTWTSARPTDLPNPNAGIDVVKTAEGKLFLVYNHLQKGRNAIHLAVSIDNGRSWSPPMVLEAGKTELSYPAVIQSSDGFLHVTYTWNRMRIRHLLIDPSRIRHQTNPKF